MNCTTFPKGHGLSTRALNLSRDCRVGINGVHFLLYLYLCSLKIKLIITNHRRFNMYSKFKIAIVCRRLRKFPDILTPCINIITTSIDLLGIQSTLINCEYMVFYKIQHALNIIGIKIYSFKVIKDEILKA